MPNVVGERFNHAVSVLHRAGLSQNSAGFPGSDSSPVMNGCTKILSQAPAPPTKVAAHTTIHVTIGMAPC